jgi:hypothetical protein
MLPIMLSAMQGWSAGTCEGKTIREINKVSLIKSLNVGSGT